MSESLCYKCAQGTLGCTSSCVSPFIEKDPGFWLTLSDVARLVNETKIDPSEFCRWTTVDEEDLEEDDDLDDRHADLMEHNDKVLLMNGNGKCFFLGENGCTVFESRPKMCRVYPFWFTEDKKKEVTITVQQEDSLEEDDCLITKAHYGCKDIPFLLKEIGETKKGMQEVVKEYIEEMELHAKHKKELEKKEIIDVLKNNGFVDKNLEVRKLNDDERNFYLPVLNK